MANPNPCSAARFKKGDPRCWRKGRPRGFDAVREMALTIANEELATKDGDKMTRLEALVRSWATSKKPILQIKFVEYAFGKVPNKTETNPFEGRRVIRLVHAHELRREQEQRAGSNGQSVGIPQRADSNR